MGELEIKDKFKYQGEFFEDKMHGKGQIRNFEKHYYYEGDFENNKKHGKGVLINEKNNNRYEGQF